jgi:hypothetical protein
MLAGLNILMNEASVVELAQSGCQVNCQAKEPAQFHRLPDKPFERFAAGILKYKHCPPLGIRESQRSDRPVWIKLVSKRVFVLEAG